MYSPSSLPPSIPPSLVEALTSRFQFLSIGVQTGLQLSGRKAVLLPAIAESSQKLRRLGSQMADLPLCSQSLFPSEIDYFRSKLDPDSSAEEKEPLSRSFSIASSTQKIKVPALNLSSFQSTQGSKIESLKNLPGEISPYYNPYYNPCYCLNSGQGKTSHLLLSQDQLIASIASSSLQRLAIYNVAQGKLLTTISSPLFVKCLKATGKRIIAGLDDGSIKIWHYLASSSTFEVSEGEKHRQAISSLLLFKDEVITASQDGTIAIAHLQTGQRRLCWIGHEKGVSGLALARKESRLFSYSKQENVIKVWNLEGDLLQVLEGHSQPISSLIATDRYLISSSDDHTLRIWNKNTGDVIGVIDGHQSSVHKLALSGNFLVSACDDGKVNVWDVATFRHQATFKGHAQAIKALAIQNGRCFTASLNLINVWNLTDASLVATLDGHRRLIQNQALLNGKVVDTSIEEYGDEITSIAINGRHLISGGESSPIRVWNLERILPPQSNLF